MRCYCGLNLAGLESALLQKTHLPGLFRKVGRQLRTEFLLTSLPGHGCPVLVALRQDLVDQARLDFAIFEFDANANRPFALVDA